MPQIRPFEAVDLASVRETGEMGRATWHFAATCLLLPMAAIASASEPMDSIGGCNGAAMTSVAEASGARDGAMIGLKDGRVVRLAGIVAPTKFDGNAESAQRATAALDAFVAGRRVVLRSAGNDPDRYGRTVAHVVVANEPAVWVQAALVKAGHARVLPGSSDPDCTKRLLILERQARGVGRGLWSDAAYSVLKADSVPTAFVAEGRFALVEAAVRRVGEAGGRLFLDFGRRHREDFTIVIPREAHAAFAAAGVDLRALSGRRVRVRGVLFSWGRPAMELQVPGALELIEADEG
jgi:endonuclease YncB( thermonuclease family)